MGTQKLRNCAATYPSLLSV